MVRYGRKRRDGTDSVGSLVPKYLHALFILFPPLLSRRTPPALPLPLPRYWCRRAVFARRRGGGRGRIRRRGRRHGGNLRAVAVAIVRSGAVYDKLAAMPPGGCESTEEKPKDARWATAETATETAITVGPGVEVSRMHGRLRVGSGVNW